MPASTLEIIAKDWEGENEVLCKILISCRSAGLFLTYYLEQIIVRIEPSAERSLIFEIQTQKDVEWYYKQYPMAKEEPEERVPYFVFNKSLSNDKLYSIAIANSYLDTELIWKFSSEYLKANPTHIISLNREIFIDAERMSKIVETTEYTEGWCFNLENLPG